ncbi:MAG: hypothetical protein A3D16_08360 [Rhodobacterales bacterium RIFCSPHIGHO2_02_FULL_62_130]|nr:MAG: hypothetical protein A3D16_08360 [Rhodobacterales bacterium RIFCSPHIGHO2_02_FULL_62_130]OHC60898.1 MAG: hypothetical protein A3E48_14485 [Rhodobacterales bacterium RIFCSPHIGHO2_12_FULL_62_75]
MSLIRPEVTALITRASEVIWATVMTGFGLWLIWLGGYLLMPLGAGVAALGLGWGIMALRRMRFAQTIAAPGMVEVDEGQVGYMGPTAGGFVSLPELTELRLITLRGRRVWRLKQADGQALLVPVDAEGAEGLFDAFTSLPGMDTAALVAALGGATGSGETLPTSHDTPDMQVIWRRQGAGVVARN